MPNIREILEKAKQAGASDVHITVGIPPKMRVNGKLVTIPDYDRMTQTDTLDVVLRIMSETQRNCFEEKGEYDMSFSLSNLGRYRVNAYKQRGSAALAFRLVATQIPSAEELGLPKTVVDLAAKRRGLILVTGPTGSGKSTTLAALIDQINNNRDAHVITLEDPIEYLHHHRQAIVNQREIGLDTDSYAKALHAALREDPDVIMLGELPDLETINIAIEAAEAGHLILSSMHTVDAACTIERILESCPPYKQQALRIQLSEVLEGIVSQQLMPTADGQGRVAAFEVLTVNKEIRGLIREGAYGRLPSAIQTNRGQGMMLMDEAIGQLCFNGRIDKETALAYARNPENMAVRL